MRRLYPRLAESSDGVCGIIQRPLFAKVATGDVSTTRGSATSELFGVHDDLVRGLLEGETL